MEIGRILRHTLTPGWLARRAFGRADLDAIEAAIAASETTHRGELRFVAEGPLDLLALLRGQSPRQRAIELFGRLGVWDTAGDSGILIYVQLVDRRVEIVADRGITAKVDQPEWEAICRTMEAAFGAGAWQRGALEALAAAGGLLARHFPASGENPNELENRPVVI